MSKPFKELRAVLMLNDIDQIYLGKLLGKGLTYVNQRMTAKRAWSQDDQYKIMDECRLPYEDMHKYFPKNGLSNVG
jgi:hypothetical protein